MEYNMIVSVFLNGKYRAYNRELIECDTIGEHKEVYVYRMKHGISRFTLTLTVTDGNIEEVIT